MYLHILIGHDISTAQSCEKWRNEDMEEQDFAQHV
jgi:hypothetical protein